MLQSRGNFLNERHYSEYLASEIESLTAENERLNKQSLAWQDEANRLKTLYNLERLKGH